MVMYDNLFFYQITGFFFFKYLRGGVVRPWDPMAMALYNDALTILIPPVLCDTTFVELYSSKQEITCNGESLYLLFSCVGYYF